jgi:bifunctional DNA-binding transcriptional regulator/antitoxin component of YhaV-PrlF toxin-antitoxin module
MPIAKADEKRRIVLPKEYVEEYGRDYIIIKVGKELIIKPLPKDPLATLIEEGKKLKGISWQQFEKKIEKKFKERT